MQELLAAPLAACPAEHHMQPPTAHGQPHSRPPALPLHLVARSGAGSSDESSSLVVGLEALISRTFCTSRATLACCCASSAPAPATSASGRRHSNASPNVS